MTPDPIILALQQQVSCYLNLSQLAGAQHVHVQKSQTDELLDVLQRRQLVLDQIAALEKIVAPAKQAWSDYLTRLTPEQRVVAEGLLANTRQLLEQITASDRNDTIVLQQRKISLGLQINKTTVARTVNKNYAAAAYGKPKSRVDIQR